MLSPAFLYLSQNPVSTLGFVCWFALGVRSRVKVKIRVWDEVGYLDRDEDGVGLGLGFCSKSWSWSR